MSYIYFDASAGISGDMLLGTLLDLGADREGFLAAVEGLGLPVRISISETMRSSLRALKVDVTIERKEHIHRRWSDIESLITGAGLPARVEERALAAFRTLFEAEARVHGREFDKTHLHEAGADDAITDIVGACWLLENLGVDTVACSPVNLGAGRVQAAHGSLPVPPPAVAEILRETPVYSSGVDQELTTPTGAALIKTLAGAFHRFPELCYRRVGCGAGGRDFPGFPNVLRGFLGEGSGFRPERTLFQIEANLDDADPRVLAAFIERALAEGALDVFLTPVVMKKNRLASKLTLLAPGERRDGLIEMVFRETPSLGVRFSPVERRVLDRETHQVEVAGQAVTVKVGRLGGEIVNSQPEYEDCRRAGEQTGLPVKTIIERATCAFFRQIESNEE